MLLLCSQCRLLGLSIEIFLMPSLICLQTFAEAGKGEELILEFGFPVAAFKGRK